MLTESSIIKLAKRATKRTAAKKGVHIHDFKNSWCRYVDTGSKIWRVERCADYYLCEQVPFIGY